MATRKTIRYPGGYTLNRTAQGGYRSAGGTGQVGGRAQAARNVRRVSVGGKGG